MSATKTLARFALDCRYDQLSPRTVKEAHRTFLNWLGCAIGAARHPTAETAWRTVSRFAGPAQASVLGRRERTDMLHAALLNGITSHTFDFDDTHLKTIIHPAGPVASAILALAETQPVSGHDFINALVLGIEVECRIGNSVYPEHYDTGWHITGTTGVFGSAAACGRLLGLNEKQMIWALGIAATQASGLREMFGSMCKPFHPGNAARNGLMAALLAKENFTSSERGIEAPRGFAHVLSTKFDESEITRNLGKTFEIDLNTYKPFACGIVIHPSIDGCAQLTAEHGLKADDIARIDLGVHPLVLELTGKKTPRVGLEGKFSVYHASACAVIYGTAGEREFADAVVADAAVIALRDRVHAEVKPGVHEHQADIRVTLRDGRVLHRFVEKSIGSLENPLSDAQLEAKFRGMANEILPASQVDALIAACWKLGDSADAAAAIVPLAVIQSA
jgi:2-methylcitrate dehydratase PrpD